MCDLLTVNLIEEQIDISMGGAEWRVPDRFQKKEEVLFYAV